MTLTILKMDAMTIPVNVPGMKILHMVPVLHMLKGLAIVPLDAIGIVVPGIPGFVGA